MSWSVYALAQIALPFAELSRCFLPAPLCGSSMRIRRNPRGSETSVFPWIASYRCVDRVGSHALHNISAAPSLPIFYYLFHPLHRLHSLIFFAFPSHSVFIYPIYFLGNTLGNFTESLGIQDTARLG
jgi:hypothetical protein